ncbi:MAG TPA: hypothetical protein PLX66_00970 [Bacilli bacterium]|nr:hypothetical protein [Bacilli bacterium]
MGKGIEKENKNHRFLGLEIKNKKRFLIFLGISIVVLIALFSFLFMDNIKEALKDIGIIKETEIKTVKIIESGPDETLSGVVIHIYKNLNDETQVLAYTDEEYEELDTNYYANLEEIAKYSCKTTDCEAESIYTISFGYSSFVIIKDDSYYLYNYETEELQKLDLNVDDRGSTRVAYYKNNIYGLLIEDYTNDTSYFYSLSNDKSYSLGVKHTSYFANYFMAVEDDSWALFDYTKNSYTKLPFSTDDYSDVDMVYYQDQLYGYFLLKTGYDIGDSGAYSLYSLSAKKIIIESFDRQSYGNMELLNNAIILDNKLYDFSTGELLYNFSSKFIKGEESEEVCYEVRAFGNSKATYYFINIDCTEGGYGYLLDKNYNILFNGEEKDSCDVAVDLDGNLIINNISEDRNSTSFSVYDTSGSLISTSKNYQAVLEVFDDGYVAIKDDDNYLKLITIDGDVVAKFVKLTDDMHFEPWQSGYYEYKNITGIYLVVKDDSILPNDEGEGGYGYEYYYDTENKTTGKIATEMGGYAKPVLYLYPTEKTNINVNFEYPNLLTTTYPKFNRFWNVTAYPNGDLYDNKGNYYYALYWEELKNHDIPFTEGFYVTKENAISFLEEKLTIIGLNAKERNEFIMYWLPILEKNGKSLVYFELTEERDSYNRLIINPEPDSLLRVAIHVKKVSKEVNIKEEKLTTFERTGFAAVEWGGVEH